VDGGCTEVSKGSMKIRHRPVSGVLQSNSPEKAT